MREGGQLHVGRVRRAGPDLQRRSEVGPEGAPRYFGIFLRLRLEQVDLERLQRSTTRPSLHSGTHPTSFTSL